MKGPWEAGFIHHSLLVVCFTISLSAGIGAWECNLTKGREG